MSATELQNSEAACRLINKMFENVYNSCQHFLWVVKYVYEDEDEACYRDGFMVHRSGLIITTARDLRRKYTFEARPFNHAEFLGANIVYLEKKSDILLLEVTCKLGKQYPFATLPRNLSLSVGQPLLNIGTLMDCPMSLTVGEVTFPCVDNPSLKSRKLCWDYESSAINCPPEYRMLGDIWNTELGYDFGHLTARVPVIQINGMESTYSNSGSPVFDLNSNIVGMLAHLDDLGFGFALHGSLIKEALQKIDQGGDRNVSQGSSSGKRKEGGDYKVSRGSSGRKRKKGSRTVSSVNVDFVDCELDKFYDHYKKVVWIIKVSCVIKEKMVEYHVTGFSVDTNVVLTCADLFIKPGGSCSILLRRLDEQESYQANPLCIKPNLGVALLQIENVRNVGDWISCELANDGGQLAAGETLLSICNHNFLVGSLLVGRAAHPCQNINIVDLHLEDKPMHSPYRIKDDFWHKQQLESMKKVLEKPTFKFLKRLNPCIPVIQISKFGYGMNRLPLDKMSCVGAPVFNVKREVVGMILNTSMDDACAIHCSVFRQVLKEWKEEEEEAKSLTLSPDLQEST